jgi:hypothetical protein
METAIIEVQHLINLADAPRVLLIRVNSTGTPFELAASKVAGTGHQRRFPDDQSLSD